MSLDGILQASLEAAASHYAGIRDIPVEPGATPQEIRAHLEARYGDLSSPQPAEEIVADVVTMLERWNIQITHPRYFGLFNPSVLPAAAAADTLVAAFNPQMAAWSHAQAANEIERFTLERLVQLIGFDPSSSVAHFTSGGAEANLTAIATALAGANPEHAERGIAAFSGQPVVYVSGESHDSFDKIVRTVGLGRGSLRRVPVDAEFRMDVEQLEGMIRSDLDTGLYPVAVVATAGTTSAGAIDPIPELARVASEFGIWLHVDAAWGGGALLSPSLRPHLEGIELADSVTWDAHKWLSVPMGAGMFFCRRPQAVHSAFGVQTPYMPAGTEARPDPYASTMQWSRRFIGLKLFMALAELGTDGYRHLVDHMTSMGTLLRERLEASGWEIVNRTPLPVICFTRPEIVRGEISAAEVASAVSRTGEAWISPVRLPGQTALRACITSFRTEPRDVEQLVDVLNRHWSS